MLVAALVFIVTYAVIVSERVNKTIAALAGGLAMILIGIISQDEAFQAIDLNVIFLLAGMMVLANALAETGVFEWLALTSVRIVRGDPVRLLLALSLVTAVLSAFLDNVTTVVLLVPVMLYVTRELGLSPRPYLLMLVFASNIGGTATLIGDPPNILIGSAAGLDFAAFLAHLAPVAVVILTLLLVGAWLLARGRLRADPELRARLLEVDPGERIKHPVQLRVGTAVLALTLLGFLFHGLLGLESGTVALTGATIMLLASRLSVHAALRDVEWETLFFFVGLFMAVAGLEHTGALALVGQLLLGLTRGDLAATALLLLWLSALLSGVVDNIPYTAAMIPVVNELGTELGMPAGADNPLWWVLALGADLGGNLTMIAASANVIVVGIARRAGYEIGFWEFIRYGAPVTLVSILVASVYVWLRYL